MYFSNDDFMDELDFCVSQSFDYMSKDKPEKFDSEETSVIK